MAGWFPQYPKVRVFSTEVALRRGTISAVLPERRC